MSDKPRRSIFIAGHDGKTVKLSVLPVDFVVSTITMQQHGMELRFPVLACITINPDDGTVAEVKSHFSLS